MADGTESAIAAATLAAAQMTVESGKYVNITPEENATYFAKRFALLYAEVRRAQTDNP